MTQNNDELRKKFENQNKLICLEWNKSIDYYLLKREFNNSNEYHRFKQSYNDKWFGYQQCAKDMQTENEQLKARIKAAGDYIATHPRDWSLNHRDAAIWSIILGWDEALPDMRTKHFWNDNSPAIELQAPKRD